MKTLKEIRFIRRIKQTDLAKQIGAPQPVISLIENGWVLPNPTLKHKIETALGEQIDWDSPVRLWKVRYNEGAEQPKQRRVPRKSD